MLGRTFSHNCSCASFKPVLSPSQKKNILPSGVSHRDSDYKIALVFEQIGDIATTY